jgi:hypothetical protein
MTHLFIVWQGPIFNHQSMTIPEHFIHLDQYVFVQGLDVVSSWWFLTIFQFCFSDKCIFPNAVLIFRALSDYQLYSLYNQLQACHSARQTRYTLCIPSACRPHTSTKVYPFPTLVNKINKYYSDIWTYIFFFKLDRTRIQTFLKEGASRGTEAQIVRRF